MIYIYALSDPEDDKIYYVGQTTDLDKRISMHIYSVAQGVQHSHREKWIASLLAQGRAPRIIELQVVKDRLAANEVELKWIWKLYKAEQPLTNQEAQRMNAHKCKSPKKRPIKPKKTKWGMTIDLSNWFHE